MDLHIVSGFLGSGKTTAIIGAAKYLMAQSKRVGVVTNDQGKYLVDTAFFQVSDVPAVEVSGGCFCCHYDDLDAQLEDLRATAHPDVIFAESVGSCADIVATVVKPMLKLRAGTRPPTSFSVFCDIRLLRRRLKGQPLPFSDNIVYIFDKQIEEAGILVINKADLLSREEAKDTLNLARARFPSKHLRLQNSLSPPKPGDTTSVAGWIEVLDSGNGLFPETLLDIDYQRYGEGEAHLAWLDEKVTLNVPEGQGRTIVLHCLNTLLSGLQKQHAPIGHLKVLIQDYPNGASEVTEVKLSFTGLPNEGNDWQAQVPHLVGTQVTMLVNARVETEAETLRGLLKRALEDTVTSTSTSYKEDNIAFFHPGFPNPTHRDVPGKGLG